MWDMACSRSKRYSSLRKKKRKKYGKKKQNDESSVYDCANPLRLSPESFEYFVVVEFLYFVSFALFATNLQLVFLLRNHRCQRSLLNVNSRNESTSPALVFSE